MAHRLCLSNPHLVCYINSAVQLLSEVKINDWGKTTLAGRFMNKIMDLKHNGHQGSFSAWTEVNSFVNDDMKHTSDQGDAHEMLLEILRCLYNDELVNSLFSITMVNVTKCLSCGNVSEKSYLANQFTVNNQLRSMNSFFNNFFVTEALGDGYECERCTKTDSARRTSAAMCQRVKLWPLYLMVHIMRFEGNYKMNNEFQFPLVFAGSDPSDPEYVLDGAIFHIGTTRESGHYTSCGRIDHGWFHYYDDDKAPRPISMLEINGAIFRQQVYVLLYRRRERKN